MKVERIIACRPVGKKAKNTCEVWVMHGVMVSMSAFPVSAPIAGVQYQVLVGA